MSGSMSGMWKRNYGEVTWAPPDERGGNRQTKPTVTAPHLDSTGFPRATDLRPERIPKHAFSEPDRLLARRQDAEAMPRLRAATTCWSDWSAKTLTAHDGVIANKHVVVLRALTQAQSATSLRRLLRDPISFVWRHALGWQSTNVPSEPLELDARTYGELVHEVLRRTVERLEPSPGFTHATQEEVRNALEAAVATVREQWPLERAVPPLLLWLHTLQFAERLAFRALTSDSFRPGTRCWTEVPFGSPREVPGQWPWDPQAMVVIPGTNVSIRGSIDRLDLNAPSTAVRVTDYKTGGEPPRAGTIVVNGGAELQRVIYAIAATQLLPDVRSVVTRLFYLREDALHAHELKDVENVIAQVGTYVASACALLEEGKCLPGLRRDEYDEYALALPAAQETYLKTKELALHRAFGSFRRIWSMP